MYNDIFHEDLCKQISIIYGRHLLEQSKNKRRNVITLFFDIELINEYIFKRLIGVSTNGKPIEVKN